MLTAGIARCIMLIRVGINPTENLIEQDGGKIWESTNMEMLSWKYTERIKT